MSTKLRLGTRDSQLAIKQVEEVIGLLKEKYPEMGFEIKEYKTSGDLDKTTPLSAVERQDFFTDTIEKALLDEEIDIAVHSAKDLPEVIPSGLVISALTKTIDPYDILVSKNNLKLDELPKGAKIGTSSRARKEGLKKFRPDLEIVDIRGNIEERLALFEHSDLEGMVIASAGLIRLGLEKRITQRIPFEIIKPHPLQGSLAIEVKKDNLGLVKLTNSMDIRGKILFVCRENSARSQIAEALLNHFYWQRFFALSSGSRLSGKVNPLAIEVMKEKGVDISSQRSKGFGEVEGIIFDYVITMGCGEECPIFPAKYRLDWQIEDPKDKPLGFFRKFREEIEERIREISVKV